MEQVKIYALIDPCDGRVRYVGRTVQPLAMRLQQHLFRASREQHPRAVWLRDLIASDRKPSIRLLEVVEANVWRRAEEKWIKSFGEQLVNSAPSGGGGTRSHVVDWTPALDARLGKEADAIIAEELGVSRKTVSYRRAKLGIAAAYDRSRNLPPPNMGGWNQKGVPEAIIERLGDMPDASLSEIAGISKRTIGRLRRARDIPSHAEQTGNDGRYLSGHYPDRWRKRTKGVCPQ